jgi:hypothetical protein
MAGTQRLLAIAMASLLTSHSGNGSADSLGMIVLADHAKLGSQAAAEGTTIYDGDRLSTDADGSLRIIVGESIVYLADQSCVTLHKGASGVAKEFAAELVSGTVVLSMTAGIAAEIVARSAHVRPMAETRGVVEVGIAGPRELIVFARRGPAQISYRGESETIAEGESYRVLLNDSEDDTPGATTAKSPGKRGKMFVVIAVAATTAAGVVALWGARDRGAKGGVESPDHP